MAPNAFRLVGENDIGGGAVRPLLDLPNLSNLSNPLSCYDHLSRYNMSTAVLIAFLLGCGVSLLASGRFTLRLIVDGALSFAFVPLCQLIAFAVIYRVQGSRRAFRTAADRYFTTNAPWLWWMLGLLVLGAALPAVRAGSVLPLALITAPVPILLSVRADWRLFRTDGRTPGQAAIDIVVQRAIAWSLAWTWFLGMAITSRDAMYLFVEAGEAIAVFVRGMF